MEVIISQMTLEQSHIQQSMSIRKCKYIFAFSGQLTTETRHTVFKHPKQSANLRYSLTKSVYM